MPLKPLPIAFLISRCTVVIEAAVARVRRGRFRIFWGLRYRGASGIVLGCTEIPLLARPEDSPVPVFDTTEIHARRVVEWALEDLA